MASAGYEESRKSTYKELGREEAVRKEKGTDKLQNTRKGVARILEKGGGGKLVSV